MQAPMKATIRLPISPPPADAQHAEQPAAQESAEDADDDVSDDAVAAALHHLPCQPSRNQADQDEPDEAHKLSSLVVKFTGDRRPDTTPERPGLRIALAPGFSPMKEMSAFR